MAETTEREKNEKTNAVSQDVLMDWYEEVVLVTDVSSNKQHRFERDDGLLIHHCKHERATLSPCHVLKKTKLRWAWGWGGRLLDLHYFMDMVYLTTGWWKLNVMLSNPSMWWQAIWTESKVTGFTGWWWLLLSNASMYFEICFWVILYYMA